MALKVTLTLVLGVLSTVIERSTSQRTVTPFCFESDCYIRPENSGKSWTDAQAICRKNNSTLPIVDNPDRQRSFVAALYNFSLSGNADVWLGARASEYGSGIWRWLDGSNYSRTGSILGTGAYNKSYGVAWKSTTNLSFAYLGESDPTDKHINSYICQYNTTNMPIDVDANGTTSLFSVNGSRSFVRYDEKLSWFSARNKCLENNGDLASLTDLSILNGIFDTDGSWVGLRHSQWNWQNSMTGSSSEVTFTSWSDNQPNDATPTCISIDGGDFPNWKDYNCSLLSQVICQIFNGTYTIEELSNGELSTTKSVPNETPGSAEDGSKNKVNVPLAVGLGVGIGGAVLIAIIIIIIVVVVMRRKRRNSRSIGSTKTKETTVNHNIQMNPKEEATEMNDNENQSQLGDYATVQGAKGSEHEPQLTSPSTGQGPVYADLGFDREGP